MGKTVYSKVKEICDDLKKESQFIEMPKLLFEIKKRIGLDERTLKRASDALNTFDLIEETPNGLRIK